MDISPIKLMQMKGKLNRFQNAHPKLMPFLNHFMIMLLAFTK